MSLDLQSSSWELKRLYAAALEAPTHELTCIRMQHFKSFRSVYMNKVAVVAKLSRTNPIHVHLFVFAETPFPKNPLGQTQVCLKQSSFTIP